MGKKRKVILSIVLPVVCIMVLCACLIPVLKKEEPVPERQQVEVSAEDTGASLADRSEKGGAVYLTNNASYTMSGGSIKGKDNTYGGAIFLESGCTFTMYDGVISGCSAKYGGAIYVSSGAVCNINGGSIETSVQFINFRLLMLSSN